MKTITTWLIGICVFGFVATGFAQETKAKAKSDHATMPGHHVVLNAAELQWMDAPPSLPPGAKLAVLSGDPGKSGLYTLRLQVPSGYKIPPHTHPTAEHVTVISGAMSFGMGPKFDESAGKKLKAGGFALMPAGMQHFAWASGKTVVQVHGKGPFQIDYVNPADDPRKAKK